MNKSLDYEFYQHSSPFKPSISKGSVIFTRLVKLSTPESLCAYYYWGSYLSDSDQHEKCIFPLQKALIIDSEDWTVAYRLTTAFSALGKDPQRFSWLRKAFKLDPTNDQAHHILIKSLEARGQLDQLESFYQETAATFEDSDSVPKLYYTAAQKLVSMNKHSLAFGFYRRVIEISPSSLDDHKSYAMTLYHERQFKEAIAEFKHVLRLDPSSVQCYHNIVFLTYLDEEIENALEGLEHILANDLDTSLTCSNIILMLYHVNEDEKEIQPYKERLRRCIQDDSETLQGMYQEELGLTQKSLDSLVNEKMKLFEMQKIKSLNFVLKLIHNIKNV